MERKKERKTDRVREREERRQGKRQSEREKGTKRECEREKERGKTGLLCTLPLRTGKTLELVPKLIEISLKRAIIGKIGE